MHKFTFFLGFLFTVSTSVVSGQSYLEKMEVNRKLYINAFLTDAHSPLTKKDIKHLDFYPIDSNYKVIGMVQLTPDAEPFDMPTSLGIMKRYVQYGVVSFQLHDSVFKLNMYQSMKLREQEAYKDHLFVPFNDNTNYTDTYGGGRYLDFKMPDITGNSIIIDFNMAYNPYCAYSGGYACPVPPAENKLQTNIRAGEKKFKSKGH